MKCPQCQFENPLGMKFCGRCGAKLPVVCSHCGTEIPQGFKFCGECGSPVSARDAEPAQLPRHPPVHDYTPPHLAEQVFQSRTALEGERKQVTVLFCDLVGSTSLAERVGPEAMHLLLNQFFELALQEIHRYEGTINQFLGDGFMALFGAPITHEDHPRRAILAALGLRRTLEERRVELGDLYGVDLKVRMGLNTGWVVVGGIGDQLRRDYTAIGDTTNLAARLQQVAEPGAILVSEATSRFLQGVQMEALEPVRVKGKEAPVAACRVLAADATQSGEMGPGAMLRTPFVGRRREMEILAELQERAEGGEGQVLGIAAEAGSGKSRLLYEFRRRLWDGETLWLAGRSLSYGGLAPYLPLLYMLRSQWGIGETDDPAAVKEKAAAGLSKAGMDAPEVLPYFLRLLGGEEGLGAATELSPQALQARTFALLRQFILQAGQGRLTVLEIEDLHWIDETSEEFLAFLIEGLTAARVLLLLTYRPGYRPRWIEKSYATQISLSRLTDQDSQVVMRAVLRRAELPEHLLPVILSRAEGNPFFLEELSRSFLERPEISVPDTIQGVLIARIDRLPEDHKRLLQTASVLGREFRLNLLSAIWEQSGDLEPLLSDLKRWEFLYEEPTAEESKYFFKHALTQEAVYQTLLTSRRKSLHAAAGRALETLYAGRLEDAYDLLAYHYSAAVVLDKAVAYLSLSAEVAARGYAHAEAAQALREALAHAERLPDSERDRRILDLALRLAESLLPLARFSETLELLSRYRESLDRLDDPFLAGRHAFWLAHTHSYLGDQTAAESAARQAIASARQAADATTEGQAWYVLSRDAFWSGRFLEGIDYGLQAVSLLEQAEDRWWQGQAYWVAGFHHYLLGQFEEAFRMMDRSSAVWQALQDPRLDPSWSTGYFHASLGDWALGIEECAAGLRNARDPLNTAAALGFLGYAYLEKGDLPRATEALEDSVERLRQAGMKQLCGWFSAFLAEARVLSGRPEAEARELALQALAVTEEVHFRYGTGLAQRALGRIARTAGQFAEAEGWLQDAVDTFRSLQAPFEVGRSQLDLALAARQAGDSAKAAGQLGEALNLFAELGAHRFVETSERLARDLGVPRVPAAAHAMAAAAERSSGSNAR
jgi:class 3 adenylate cyclase/tetratricopeptide (TPR) repeat protein